MKKLTRILQKLDHQQMNKLQNYLYKNHSLAQKPTLELFNYLHQYHPLFNQCNFETYLHQFPHHKISKTEFRLQCSYLLAMVFQFISADNIESNAGILSPTLIQFLIRNEEFNEARRQLALYKARHIENGPIGSHNYYSEVLWNDQKLDLSFSHDMQTGNHEIETYFQSLDKLHVGLQLKYLLPALAAQRIYGIQFPTERWEYCRKKMEQWGENAPPLAQMSYLLIQLFQSANPILFEKLNYLIDKYSERMIATERINIYGYVLNYLTARQSQGDKHALKAMFQLFQRMDRENLIFGRGSFTETLVKNLINISCRLGELSWAEKFLAQNQSKILQSAGENVWHYITAFHQFYAKQYSQALKNLQAVKTTAPNYRTSHQTLLLRIYYELNDFESVEAVAATFRRYLNRNDQLSDRLKDLNRNFISIVQLLTKIKEQGMSIYRKRRIEEFLGSDQGITDRTWLEEKFNELNK